MKTNTFKLISIAVLFVIPSVLLAQKKQNVIKTDSVASDSIKYDLVVFETGYEVYLLQQPQMNHYSESYYKTWNTFYVAEWNIRYIENRLVGADQEQIWYDPQTEYGIELEYKLYYFFRFIEHKYGITLVKRVSGA